MKDINKIINNLFSGFNDKQKKIINERFGLNGERRTLQAVGDDLGITRERVRQIENQATKALKAQIKKEFSDLIKIAEKVINKKKGVCRDDKFIEEVKKVSKVKDSNHLDNKIRFIFLISGVPCFNKEDDNVYAFWYRKEGDKKNLFNYLKEAIKFFEKNKEDILEKKIYKEKFKNSEFDNFISISKHFGENAFGDFGLKKWPEIEPKVIRDKAHLVLRKKNKPLHFLEISKEIRNAGVDGKRVHIQTVHNELIKDNRFVLVGRGIYGLKNHGYEGGTVKEVIKKILKENGPLSADQIVKLVNQKKILKENTILLNLHSGDHFESIGGGKYRIKKA
jgi:DNA-directed RNA polymerase delta subunit